MRFHVPALPGQPLVKENSSCAYTQKVRKFAVMMHLLGHDVYTYGSAGQDGHWTEHVACYPEVDEPPAFSPDAWHAFNLAAVMAIDDRQADGDFLCLIGGRCQEWLAEQLPRMYAVEFGIGYGGVFAPYRVFESYAWQAAVMAQYSGDAHSIDGRFYDAVIPNYFETQDFPLGAGGDGLLYVGRLTERKGLEVCVTVARELGLELTCAGEGDFQPEGAHYVGAVGPKERAELMGSARALLAPTLYLEPFGGVVVEAHLCGTPTITTDWGAFPETVSQGRDGYRCHTIGEFCHGVELCEHLDREQIRISARSQYSTQTISHRYERYFERLQTLDEAGFYSAWSGL